VPGRKRPPSLDRIDSVVSWLSAVPAFLAIVALLYVPGALLCAAVGTRGFLLLATAPGVTVAAMACLAIVFPFIGIGWSVISVGIGIVIIAALAWAMRLLIRRRIGAERAPRPAGDGRWIAIAMIVAGVVIAVQLVIAIGRPDNISQTFDAIYHLNTLRYIQDTANASSLHVNQLVVPPGRAGLYPAAWHALASLAIELTGVSIPLGVNLVNIAIAALVWPASLIALIRVLIPRNRVAIVVTGVIAAAFPGFPLLMLTYGVLYPYFLSLALLPLAIALGIAVAGSRGGVREQVPHGRYRVLNSVLLVAVLIAIVLAQPSVVFAWFAFLIPLLLTRVITFVRTPISTRARVLTWTLTGIALVVFAIAWVAIGRIGANSPWPDYTNVFGAVYEGIASTKQGAPIAIALAVLTVAGIVHLIRNPGRRWYLGTWGIGLGMFVASAALPSWKLRAYTVGLFYRDPPRLYSLLVIVAAPMAIFGAVAIWRFCRDRLRAWLEARRPRSCAPIMRGIAALAGLVLVALTQSQPIWHAVGAAQTTYALTPTAPLLSTDERTLIERVPSEVPAGVRVAGNPWTGTAFLYALTGQPVLTPHFSAVIDGRAPIINLKLNEARTDPSVCAAVRALNVGYVLDFGTYMHDAGKTGVKIDGTSGYTGLYNLVHDGLATEVDHQGPAAKLLKITACS
jgi:hypothetical protein